MARKEQFLWEYLKKETKPIAMLGIGDGADKIYDTLHLKGIKPFCFTSFRGLPKNSVFRGHRCMSLEDVKRFCGDSVIFLVCFGSDKPEVIKSIYDLAAEGYEVYAPDVPTSFLDVYDERFLLDYKFELEKARNLLSDDESVRVFDTWLDFRTSGDIDTLKKFEHTREDILDILNIGNKARNECFVDCGAYRGDTVEEFLGLIKKAYGSIVSGEINPDGSERVNFNKIIAIEPDPYNFTKLRRKFQNLGSGIFAPINAAVHDDDEMLEFIKKTGRGGRVSDSNTKSKKSNENEQNNQPANTDNLLVIPDNEKNYDPEERYRRRKIEFVDVNGMKIDTICKNEAPTYIKLDVEGAEYRTLRGAEQTILKHHPKLMVSLYHVGEDMFRIPIYLSKLCKYKFYLRRTPCIPAWDVQLICTI